MTPTDTTRIFSFGGGVQSTAVLALQIMGKLERPYDYFVFANVGHDSENPETLAYLADVIYPLVDQHNICFIELKKQYKGNDDTLYQAIYRSKGIVIPARLPKSGMPAKRQCTTDFKVKLIERWVKRQGFTDIELGLGISLDEFTRMRDTQWHDAEGNHKLGFNRKLEYPLIDMRLSRTDCHNIISEFGLPIAPKSACWFCPFTRKNEWVLRRNNQPKLFEKAVQLEEDLERKLGYPVYLHPSKYPLENAVANGQLEMFPDEDDTCDSGHCWT